MEDNIYVMLHGNDISKKKKQVEEHWRESERWQTEKDLALSLLEAGATSQGSEFCQQSK